MYKVKIDLSHLLQRLGRFMDLRKYMTEMQQTALKKFNILLNECILM